MRGPSLLAAACCLLRLTVASAAVQRMMAPRLVARTNSSAPVPNPLQRLNASGGGDGIKPGTELRILCVGDSITVGLFSDDDGGDGNGYRLRLRDDLSADNVTMVGTVTAPHGNMSDGFFAAWSGKTIQFMSDNVGPSLQQQPNVILLHAGTNDMNSDPAFSTEGDDPVKAVQRLGALVDRMVKACPDAVVLVAMIIPTCDAEQEPRTQDFQRLIPGMVQQRLDDGHHVLAADMTTFPTSELRDCVHPTNSGYQLMGDYWHDFVTQIPGGWIKRPAGVDARESSAINGGGLLPVPVVAAGAAAALAVLAGSVVGA